MTSNKTLVENMRRRLTDTGVYLDLSIRPKISTRAKSAYLRAAIMLSATVVEGLVLLLIRRSTGELDPAIKTVSERRAVYSFDKSHPVFGGMTICKMEEEKVTLMGRKVAFIS